MKIQDYISLNLHQWVRWIAHRKSLGLKSYATDQNKQRLSKLSKLEQKQIIDRSILNRKGMLHFKAARASKKRRKKRKPAKASDAQMQYIGSMCNKLGINQSQYQGLTKVKASKVIEDLISDVEQSKLNNIDENSNISVFASNQTQLELNPILSLDPKAPRKYKSIAMHFNRYEFERLDDAVANTDMGKSKFIRAALEVACKKALK